MQTLKRTGAKAMVFYDTFDAERVIDGNGTLATEEGRWYEIVERGAASDLPENISIFRAPIKGQQIVLQTGDKVFPIDPNRICKTSCSVSMEEGAVDASDDCDPGASILDGNVKISGSLAGLYRYNKVTEDFDDVSKDVLSKFVKSVQDDGSGAYNITERENAQINLFINLNSDAKKGQTEHWLLVPAIISSANINLGNTDMQNQDMSWTKGEGEAAIYSAVKAG